MDASRAWKIILVWFSIALAILAIAGEWRVVLFASTYGLLFGYVQYRWRHRIRPAFKSLRLDNFYGFILLSVLSTVLEETYCYLTGNRIAQPVLWVDLILVTGIWLGWFGAWYLILARKYSYSENEALLLAGSTGFIYEFIGTLAVLQNPFGFLIALPMAVVVYTSIIMLPMQLIDFTGTDSRPVKYIAGIFLPYLLSLPLALLMWIVFMLAGIPLK